MKIEDGDEDGYRTHPHVTSTFHTSVDTVVLSWEGKEVGEQENQNQKSEISRLRVRDAEIQTQRQEIRN